MAGYKFYTSGEKYCEQGPRIVWDKIAFYGVYWQPDDIIFSTEPGIWDNSEVLAVKTFKTVWVLGGLWDGRV